MRVTNTDTAPNDSSTETEKKPRKAKHTITKASEKAAAEAAKTEAAGKGADAKGDAATKPEVKAKTTESVEKTPKLPPAGASVHDTAQKPGESAGSDDSRVLLSPAGKAASQTDREIREAETLMDHVDSGKLSGEEHSLAMKRIGEILKKYNKL